MPKREKVFEIKTFLLEKSTNPNKIFVKNY